jgi:U1 small nuclear ribonucleoprotein
MFSSEVELVGLCPPGRYPFPRQYQVDEEKREETRKRRQSARLDRIEKTRERIEQLAESYNPKEDPENKKTTEAYNTLFVGNLKPTVQKSELQKHFEEFGKIVNIVHFPKRHYAFIEFSDGEMVKTAYAKANGMRLNGNRIVIDVERARTVPGWKPKVLGGGAVQKEKDYNRGVRDDRKRSRGDRDYRRDGRDWDRGDRGGNWEGNRNRRFDSDSSKRRRR